MRLDALLRPRSIAILGASERPSIGRTLIESLDAVGFAGPVYPINPRYDTLLGRRCYASVADLPRDVDVLAFCVNHARVLEHMRPAAERALHRDRVVWLGSVQDDGSPHLVPVWFHWDGEQIVAFSKPNARGFRRPHGSCVRAADF